ncbi:MAG: alpha/beta fold hydrolase [Acidimicrobiales bacterium]
MSSSVRRLASTDGVQVALHHLGGTGDHLLICHATGFHGRAYEPFARRLAEHFTVWAVDMRGHGATDPPESGDFSWRGMARDVQTCIDEIGAPVFAFGHSMGGAAIVLTELARPGSIRAAYLFEPIILPDSVEIASNDNSMSAAARRRRAEFDSREDVLARYGSRPPLGLLEPDALRAYVAHGFVDTEQGTVRLACEPEHEARTFEAPDKPRVADLEGLNIPLMVAAGLVDGEMSPAHFALATAARGEGAILVRHDDIFHFGPLENPDLIASDLINWLRSPQI